MNLFEKLLTNSHDGNYDNITEIISCYFRKLENCEIIIQSISENKCNVIAKWGNPELLINVHLDTVKPCFGWNTNPYKLIDKEGNLYGLGTCDTKGNIYAIYESLCQITPKNLMLLFSVDEESNTIESGVTHFLNTEFVSGIKRAIVCEPTNNLIADSHKGYYAFYLKTNTISRHSSNEEHLFDNAIYKISKYFNKLIKDGYNLGKISGGSAGNIIASECLLHISKRSENEFESIYDNLKKILGKEVLIETKTVLPALKSKKGKDNLIFKADLESLNFWTEASLFQLQGIDSIVYGVGDIQQAHTANEYISKFSLEKGIEFFKEVIKNENTR